MRKKDVLELKRRFKKDECTFTKMCGCYVNSNKNIILNIKETFLNLDEDEFFKYLEIAKKTLSGTLGNNLLELNFPSEQEETGGTQYDLMALKKSALKDDALLEKLYKSIIDNYDYEGNYLILVFHDAYDVITKTTDNLKLDESEEVYEYILCAICPVSLSKPGLRYFEDDNRIGARIRDWIVEPPANGFLFPAFTERSSDIDSLLYFTKNAKDTHPELMEGTLGCPYKTTATEQKEAFTNIIKNAVGSDDEKSEHLFMEIQENLNNMVDEYNDTTVSNTPMVLTNDSISEVLADSGVPEEISTKIEKCYTEEFKDAPPVIEHLLDKKTLEKNEQRKKEEKLKKKVQVLQTELDKRKEELKDDSENNDLDEQSIEDNNITDYDIILNVKPQKVSEIKSEIINGQKCIVIPVKENEQAKVNGVDTIL